tara:strand:- start:706 stop:996 length:291 start_codon:yes stop_codon:yes gene_type:complete
MNKMTPNKKRMHSYAKAGGLNAFKDGGSVLDNSDGVITSLAAAAAKSAARVAKKFASKITNATDNFVNKNLRKTPELKRETRKVIAQRNYKPKNGR